MGKGKLHSWLFATMVVALYLPNFFSTLSIALFLLYALLQNGIRRPGANFWQKNKLPVLFSLYFVIALLSITYSENKTAAWGALANISSFALLPWAIVSFSLAEQHQMIRRASLWFIISTLLVGIYYYAAALTVNSGVMFLQYLAPIDLDEAFDIQILSVRDLSSDYMHPGYFSLYLGIALMMSLSKAIASKQFWHRFFFYFTALAFFWLMFLLQSRMTVISLLLVSVIYVLSLSQVRKFSIAVILALVGLLWLVVKVAPEEITGRYLEFQSLEYTKGDQDFNGITVRLAVWDDVFEVIREHPVLGVGLGDYRDEIISVFEKTGFNEAILHRLDPHNQYLSTWVSIGLPGLIVLVLIFYFLIAGPYKQGHMLAFSMALFVALACISESVLIRHLGIVMLCSIVFTYSNLPLRKKEEFKLE